MLIIYQNKSACIICKIYICGMCIQYMIELFNSYIKYVDICLLFKIDNYNINRWLYLLKTKTKNKYYL